jgi:SSS family solute:Na+ symporter
MASLSLIDLIVLLGTLGFIALYGTLKTRGEKNMDQYLRSGGEKKWWAICLSIMATQASAITFISTPGQAYESGMGFLQIYFGLPLAMIVISAVFIPMFYKLNVYTAYEYLETRFNVQTRQFVAFLFLMSRALGAGLTIYAPAIILSTILGFNLDLMCLFIGLVVIIYIYSGGEKAVSQTQMLQMVVILSGMAMALVMLIHYLPAGVSVFDATYLAGKLGKMKVVDTHFDVKERYNLWAGLLGGFFLSLSYFGTDQSQVSRYLGGTSVNESKLGLFFNGIVKIPMQFFILFIGVMMFVFFIFNPSPVFFNNKALEKANLSADVKQQIAAKQSEHFQIEGQRNIAAINVLRTKGTAQENENLSTLRLLNEKDNSIRQDVKNIIKKANPDIATKDTDYVFLNFVLNNMPKGLIGLLLAVMFCAAMSSTSGQISSLASTTVVDFYKRSINKNGTDAHYVKATKYSTLLWGAVIIGFAVSLRLFDNLVQAVNIVGSLFYGTILGVFLVAFFFKSVKGTATFWAAILSEGMIVALYFIDKHESISFLWYNAIGPVLVIGLSILLNLLLPESNTQSQN